MRSRILLAPAFIAMIAMTGCTGERATTSYTAPGLDRADLAFVTDSYNIVHFDLGEDGLVSSHTQNPAVIEMASYLTERATYFQSVLRPAAIRAGVVPPTTIDPALKVKLDHLGTLNGSAFDRAYVADQLQSHQSALANAMRRQGQMQDKGLLRYLPASIQQLQETIAKLQALQAQVGTPDAT